MKRMRMQGSGLPALATAALLVALPTGPAGAYVEAGPIVNPTTGNLYYRLSLDTWAGAEAEARGLGGHLVAIGDSFENDWVWNTFAPLGGGPLWIGLNDTAQEGYFWWSNGDPYGYSSWWTAGGEPNDAGGVEDWAEINNGVWNDTDGFGPNSAVAEVADAPLFEFVQGLPIPLPPIEPESAWVQQFALSSDGKHLYGLYGVSQGNDLVLIYARGADGSLGFVDSTVVAGNPIAMAMTADGSALFVIGNNGNLQAWQRDAATGLLGFAGEIYDNQQGANYLQYPSDVAVSPDGENVYVASSENAITVFSWDGAALGAITAAFTSGLGVGPPTRVVVTPDGKYVLTVTASDGTLLVYARDAQNGGLLSYVGRFVDGENGVDGLTGPAGLYVAPTPAQGSAIYAIGYTDQKIATFAEGPSGVSFVEAAPLLNGTGAFAFGPDPALAFAVDGIRNGLVAFARDPGTGSIGGLVDSIFDTSIAVDGLYGPTAVAASPDGRFVYTSARSEGILGVFAVTTAPEPGALAVAITALGAIGAIARRR